jgi:hypothetical protein
MNTQFIWQSHQPGAFPLAFDLGPVWVLAEGMGLKDNLLHHLRAVDRPAPEW